MSFRTVWSRMALTAGIVLTLLLLVAPAAIAQDKSLTWERFDVDITVNQDGTFDVCEHQQIRFDEGTFTFGYRDIPGNNLGALDVYSVTDASGHTYTQAGGDYRYTVESNGGGAVVRWYFPTKSRETETFTLCYVVYEGLRFYPGNNQVWWKAVYADRAFPVLESRGTVNLEP